MSEGDALKAAIWAALEANKRLQKLTQARQDSPDAFTTFLSIHACISRHVITEWAEDATVLNLNTAFVTRCVEVHDAFLAGDFPTAGRSWTAVLNLNSATTGDTTLLLARMAYIHILEDLPAALCKARVPKSDYDQVYGFIIACLDRIATQSHRSVESPVGVLTRLVNHSFPGRQIRNTSVHLARELAWQRHLLLQKERGAA